jgi:hypothetical protein
MATSPRSRLVLPWEVARESEDRAASLACLVVALLLAWIFG